MRWNRIMLTFGFGIILFLFLIGCNTVKKLKNEHIFIKPEDEAIAYRGRVLKLNPDSVLLAWSGTQIILNFEADTLWAHFGDVEPDSLNGDFTANYYNVILDDSLWQIIQVSKLDTVFEFSGWAPGKHQISFFKRTEALFGVDLFQGFSLSTGAKVFPNSMPSPTIEFIGNSITAGYGNEGKDQSCPFSADTENHYMSYAALTARRLGWAHTAVCWSARGLMRNYDGSSEGTMMELWERTLPYADAPDWEFDTVEPEIVVINLGTNDFAKGIPDSVYFVNNYIRFIKKIRKHYPVARIICANGPILKGEKLDILAQYLKMIKNEFKDDSIHTFLFSPQTGGLGFGCDWHPSLQQHEKMATELSQFINKEVLN